MKVKESIILLRPTPLAAITLSIPWTQVPEEHGEQQHCSRPDKIADHIILLLLMLLTLVHSPCLSPCKA